MLSKLLLSSFSHPMLSKLSSFSHPMLSKLSSISHPMLSKLSSFSHPMLSKLSSFSHLIGLDLNHVVYQYVAEVCCFVWVYLDYKRFRDDCYLIMSCHIRKNHDFSRMFNRFIRRGCLIDLYIEDV